MPNNIANQIQRWLNRDDSMDGYDPVALLEWAIQEIRRLEGVKPKTKADLPIRDAQNAFHIWVGSDAFCLDQTWGTDEENPFLDEQTRMAYMIWLVAWKASQGNHDV